MKYMVKVRRRGEYRRYRYYSAFPFIKYSTINSTINNVKSVNTVLPWFFISRLVLHLRSQARFTRPEFNFLESKYERSGFSQTLPYVGAGGPVVLASVLCAYAHAHGQACRTRVNMHVCVCNARRLLLPVSSPTFYVPCALREGQFRGLGEAWRMTSGIWIVREPAGMKRSL